MYENISTQYNNSYDLFNRVNRPNNKPKKYRKIGGSLVVEYIVVRKNTIAMEDMIIPYGNDDATPCPSSPPSSCSRNVDNGIEKKSSDNCCVVDEDVMVDD